MDAHGRSYFFHHGNEIIGLASVPVDIKYNPVLKRNSSDDLLLDCLLTPISLRA